ncbi:MAG: hypothetical protein KHW88_03660 [Lachnospiraceae bacterium]|jgi:hypothetical protein|nr:hypothetical protein [Lachnospiraceae bacterium]DAR47882.1 MAG TPA: hypothetical protein [Bacteriophage sp.]
MELRDTVEMMNSSDYKERFRAEYQQVVIRYQKLKDMMIRWCKDELDFKPTCSKMVYFAQLSAMHKYMEILEARAVMEGVEL